MTSTLITESGDTLVMESVAGIAGVSSLNDISIVAITKYTFATNPISDGWLIGADWQWDSINGYIEII